MEEKMGFFARLKSGLTKTRDNLSYNLDSVFHANSSFHNYSITENTTTQYFVLDFNTTKWYGYTMKW